jgi:3-hydroxyacyl-CoA dehydrogenase / enoyl-CoA hydratase / 3-hydroxybutyryl-CoA epimerase
MGKVWDVLAPRNLELGPLAGQVFAGQARAPSPWRNFMLARDDDGIAWLALDKADASANTLSEDVLAELNDVLATLEHDMPKGLVLRSAKRKGFIAGADIGEFRGMTDAAAVEARLVQAHAVVDRLDRLAAPTVAVVHGYCLGGGLEIALACDYRIAVEDASLGFPEVLLGLHPGLGGTVRLPRLINPLEAMTMMLTGRNARARRAKSLGLVDAVVPERHVKAAATAAVTGRLQTRRGSLLGEVINSTYGRKLAAKRMRAETEKKAPVAHYPAPHALIDLWETHGGNAQAMQRAEIASFARLIVTHTTLLEARTRRPHLPLTSRSGAWSGGAGCSPPTSCRRSRSG